MPQDETSASTSLATCDDATAVEQVAKWILTGARDADVLEAIAATWPERDALALVMQAITQLKASANVDRDTVRGFVFEARKDLYRQMREIGDFAGALRALKDISADLAV